MPASTVLLGFIGGALVVYPDSLVVNFIGGACFFVSGYLRGVTHGHR